MAESPAMAVRVLEVENYRSLRRLRVDLSSPAVILGPNGSGKTNLYRLSGTSPIVLEKRDGETVVADPP